MRPAVLVLTALSLVGCTALAPGEPVDLLTGDNPYFSSGDGCYTNSALGPRISECRS